MTALEQAGTDAPAEAAATAQVAGSDAKAADLADCSREQLLALRFNESVDALMDKALEENALAEFADVLAFHLARIVVGTGGPAVAGDVLRRLGRHISALAETRKAGEEAEAARQEGRFPH